MSRSAPTDFPFPVTRRNSGPYAIRANFSQVSKVTTGQVASDEPRLDLAPAGLATQRDQHALVREKLDPSAAIFGLVATAIEADDLRAPEPPGEAEEQNSAIAQPPQRATVERFQHGDKIVAQDGFLLTGRGGVFVADAGEHGGDMPVLPVERLTAL